MPLESPSHRCGPSAGRRAAIARPGLALAACALLAAGCEEERHVASSRPNSRAAEIVGVDTGGGENPAPARAPAATAKKEPVFIVGKRTQDIKDASAELKTGQAHQVAPRIVARDPITLQGNAYVSIIGQTSILNIQHAMDLYHATNDRYPKDYDEFMNEIIKANNIALPRLPHYQEYGYDAAQHKLIIIEYPDRK